MKEYALLGVYSDICHRHFMPHRAINYIIECFGYFLVFHSIYYRTHQKVTKTLNKVINSSMKHKMLMAYVRIYTQQSIFFHKVPSDHQNDNFEAFSWLSMLLIADNTNTNSCQAWILVNSQMWLLLTQAYDIVRFLGIIWSKRPIATHMYENFLNICWNIHMGGLLKSVNFFWYAL